MVSFWTSSQRLSLPQRRNLKLDHEVVYRETLDSNTQGCRSHLPLLSSHFRCQYLEGVVLKFQNQWGSNIPFRRIPSFQVLCLCAQYLISGCIRGLGLCKPPRTLSQFHWSTYMGGDTSCPRLSSNLKASRGSLCLGKLPSCLLWVYMRIRVIKSYGWFSWDKMFLSIMTELRHFFASTLALDISLSA